MQNYHWTETNISSPLSKKIKQKLKEMNYSLTFTEIEGQLFNRMNKKKVNYFLTIKAKKQDSSDIMEMADFTPQSLVEEIKCSNLEDRNSFFEFVKFLENEFMQNNFVYKEESKPFLVYKLSCQKNEFFDFMFNPVFIKKWCDNFKKEDFYFYDNVILKDVCVKEDECVFDVKNGDHFYKCKFVITDDLYLKVFMERRNEFVSLFNALFTKMGGTFGFRFNLINE
ncbi:hypothetical protein TUBRATIS_20960 [Tubulinosema ratisbonensis]|uniref:Uncharacterized protein n=1 Tax=Tubulinosema ratisbonensis TaxID=291195 RepID=A0A437AJT1_9MICR|nr:hypothetical protein TUBRATIS_20960 [Tubulinosema ratisbonensis]